MDFQRLAISVVVGTLTMGATAFADASLPNYTVTPLTQADVDLYMSIMRAAAQHNAHLAGDDKAAADYTISLQKNPPKPITALPTQAQMKEMERNAMLGGRAAELASYDEVIARQRGVEDRYDGIKNEVDQAYARASGQGADCGGCGGSLTAAQIENGKKTEAALKADAPLVKPHVAEIKALKQQIGGFMFGNMQ